MQTPMTSPEPQSSSNPISPPQKQPTNAPPDTQPAPNLSIPPNTVSESLLHDGHSAAFTALTTTHPWFNHPWKRLSYHAEASYGSFVLTWFREPTQVSEVYGYLGGGSYRYLVVGPEGIYELDDLDVQIRLIGRGKEVLDGEWVEGFDPDNDLGEGGDEDEDEYLVDGEYPEDFDFSLFCVN
ncbi:hypothetical protein BJ508DRAFT_314650 [Ascobolus immersus RN42]|uniref:Uncharacterized protein n=1 Tax=Ascobolus immersus RN42 TaxID=1160509 RepID=A0A3N4HSA9_ASCIM|nr:hypothetical protein BJ508DRAFT_314650 [Ascobolus immersus RN42]